MLVRPRHYCAACRFSLASKKEERAVAKAPDALSIATDAKGLVGLKQKLKETSKA